MAIVLVMQLQAPTQIAQPQIQLHLAHNGMQNQKVGMPEQIFLLNSIIA